MAPANGSGRGRARENFFTSSSFADALLTRQLTYCGTVRKNRQFLPPAILNINHRQVNSSVFAFCNSTTFVSYVPKRRKNVVLLSTQHHNGEIHEEREDKKPEILLHYNKTKGAGLLWISLCELTLVSTIAPMANGLHPKHPRHCCLQCV